jgi:3-isopropylmalate/(R)-2-methylmalate dehydratase small subunit
MNKDIRGKVHKYQDNINTDIISPPQYMELSIEESAQYAMSAIDPDFYKKVQKGDILVAGTNFGSGSSRETSPLVLKYLGIGAIVAKFFARIFYRNAINVGIPVIECEEVDKIASGDEISINLEDGCIQNLTKGESYPCSKIPPHIAELIHVGGMYEYLKQQSKV